MLGNPVAQAYIKPPGSPQVYGEFRVTAAFGVIDADHPTPHIGVDIGNGKCGDTLLAMATGPISLAQGLPTSLGTALVVRGLVDGHRDHEWAIAHCAKLLVAKGVWVTRGQPVAILGSTGANACHAHLGLKVLTNGAWVERDIWPYLDQNSAGGDMIPIPGGNYTRLANKRTSLVAVGNFRDERKAGQVLKQYPAGTVFYPVASANDGDVPAGSASPVWYYGILYDDSPAGYIGGWFHSSLLGPLVDDVAVAGGHTDQELADAAKGAAHAAALATAKGASDVAAKYPA